MSNHISHNYFVVFRDYGRRGLEAVVQPETTRRIDGNGTVIAAGHEAVVDPDISRAEVIDRIASGEYRDIAFIHHVDGGLVEDVTVELIDAADALLQESAA